MHHVRTAWIRWAIAATVACACAAAVSPAALAKVRRTYTLVVSPARVLPAKSKRFFVALTNTSSKGTPLGSAKIAPPPGFKLKRAVLPRGAHGHLRIRRNVVVLSGLSVLPGSTLQVRVTATSPAACTPPTRWRSSAWEGQFGGGRLGLRRGGSRRATEVSCPYSLRFAVEPDDAVVGQRITGSPDDPNGPPVTIEVVDGNGALVPVRTPVTITLGNNRGGATLHGQTTGATAGGVLRLTDLTVDKPESAYTLIASSPGLTSATSTPFDEDTQVAACPPNQPCQVMVSGANSTFSVGAGAGPEAATLGASVNPGTPQSCPGYQTNNPDWFGFDVSQADRSKTITWTVNNSNPKSFQVCFGAPYEFTTSSGKPAPSATMPDGSRGFLGLLPSCGRVAAPSGPCVESITSTQNGTGTIAMVFIPAGLPGDPFIGR
jgi:hypothetical protein